MTPRSYLESAAAKLRTAGWRVTEETLAGGPVTVAYRRFFKLRWFATQLKTGFVLASAESVDATTFGRFVDEATRHVTSIKGGLPRGFQSGYAAIPVIFAASVDPAAAALAAERPAKKFAAVVLPALVDTTTGQVHSYSGRMVWGAAYTSWLRQQIRFVTTQ